MARPGGVFCTPFDLQNLSYTNTGGVCGVAPITSLYALRRPRKFPAICGDSGAQKSFSDVRGSNRAGGGYLFVTWRYVTFYAGITWGVSSIFFSAADGFSWWVMSVDEYFLSSGNKKGHIARPVKVNDYSIIGEYLFLSWRHS
ncbi:hypothetical protein OEA01_005109 [Escherichia coli]|nr:hypothetical protein [Escherichia coli]EJX5464107.1 hypothetical protein [Escherichia coli]